LPFGRFLTENQANYLVGHYRTTRLTNNCRTQLLYWYLARSHATPLRPPVSHLSIFYEPDQLWFNHIASYSQQITDRLLQGHRTYILARFALSHTSIELDFEELRLITQRFGSLPPAITAPHRIVRCIGKSYFYLWDNPRWTLVTRNQDSRLVDPESAFFLSPDSPGDTDFLNRVQEPLRYYTPDLEEGIRPLDDYPPPLELNSEPINLPPSNASSTSLPTHRSTPPEEWRHPSPDNGWQHTSHWNNPGHCYCGKEVCDCGFRPNTPPTPPSVTLWSPGDKHLPSRN
jgi:hypothetical protein